MNNFYQNLGVIDPGYRGNVFITLINHGNKAFKIKPGDRVAQIIIERYAKVIICETELSPSVRGVNCLGSTGLQTIGENNPIADVKLEQDFMTIIYN